MTVSLSQLIIPGCIAGLFSVLVAFMVAVYNRPKNDADATSAIVASAKIVVDMNVDEVERQDAKIVRLHAKLNRLRAYIRDLISRLEANNVAVPPVPTAFEADDDEEE